MSYQPTPDDIRCARCQEWYHKALRSCPMCDTPQASPKTPQKTSYAASPPGPVKNTHGIKPIERFLLWASTLIVLGTGGAFAITRLIDFKAPAAHSALANYIIKRNIEIYGDRARCTLVVAQYRNSKVTKKGEGVYSVETTALIESPWGIPVEGIVSADLVFLGGDQWAVRSYAPRNPQGVGYPLSVPINGSPPARTIFFTDARDLDEWRWEQTHNGQGSGMVALSPDGGRAVWSPTSLNLLFDQKRAGYLSAETPVRPLKLVFDYWDVEVLAGEHQGQRVCVDSEAITLPKEKEFTCHDEEQLPEKRKP